ncbi:MAG: hypothetical protein ACLFM7_13540, partial [Bacteroidales bacterium]
MKQENTDVYDFYDKFLNEFLIMKKSFLTGNEDILNDQSLNECKHKFIDNFKEGNESFDGKLQKQFEGSDIETLLVFA